jgi:hypothetical protein
MPHPTKAKMHNYGAHRDGSAFEPLLRVSRNELFQATDVEEYLLESFLPPVLAWLVAYDETSCQHVIHLLKRTNRKTTIDRDNERAVDKKDHMSVVVSQERKTYNMLNKGAFTKSKDILDRCDLYCRDYFLKQQRGSCEGHRKKIASIW